MDIYASIWRYVRDEMESGNKEDFSSFKNIYIRHLGTFFANEGKYNGVNKRKRND